MALSTTQYGYIIDPMVPFTDDKGNTIKDGFVRVFVAGSSTPVVTYRNFDGATNQVLIELDNSGRTRTSVIGSKGLTYKVCVYDAFHSQESPILTVDKVSVIGANITAGAGSTLVTGLDGLTTKPDGFVDASVVGTDGYVALDHTLVTDDLDTDAKVTAVENDRYVPLLNEDVNDPDSKMTLGRLPKWVLGKIKSLSTTITAFRTGDVIPVDGPSGTAKMPAGNLAIRSVQDRLCENDAAIEGKVGYKSIAFVLDYDSSDIYKTDGTHATYEAWHSTDFIDCTGFSSLDVRGCDSTIGATVISVISFFDENHDIVSYANVSGGVTSIVNTHIEVPDNASYFRAVYQDQKIQNPYVRGWLKSGSAFADKSVEPIVSYLKDVVGANEELAKSTDYTSNTIYNINGGTGSYEAWKSTDFINCVGFEKILVRGVEYKVGALTLPVISFFDSGKQFMVGYHTSGGNNHVVNGKEYAVPSGASFFRVITCTNDINDPYARGLIGGLVDVEVETQSLRDIINLKIACVGDSLTEGDYGSEPEGTMNIGADTYPTYLHRQLGSDVKNYGRCGYSASMYWSSKVQTIAWSTEKPQVVVIMLGVNGGLTDTLDVDVEPYNNYTDYANTNTGCYCKIIEYINEQLAGKSQIILCKTPYVDPTRRPVYAARAVQANLVIPKIAERYNLPVIDTTELGLSSINTHVLQPIDGLHFGKFGYSRLGTFIGSQIKSLMSFDLG